MTPRAVTSLSRGRRVSAGLAVELVEVPADERKRQPARVEVQAPVDAVLVWTPEKGWHGIVSPPDWWWEALTE